MYKQQQISEKYPNFPFELYQSEISKQDFQSLQNWINIFIKKGFHLYSIREEAIEYILNQVESKYKRQYDVRFFRNKTLANFISGRDLNKLVREFVVAYEIKENTNMPIQIAETLTYNDETQEKNIIEDEEINKLKVPTDNINICFVGGVSTGKSTILNALFCEQLTQCKIKRTTMVPTIYIENENNPFYITPSEEIFKKITEKNKKLIDKTENGEKILKTDYEELVFNVGKLDINILQNAYVNVYDIPGLNDARTKDIYYEYLETNFHKFNLLTFIVDIHSGLNTSDEIDIVNFITTNTRYQLEKNNKKIYTMVIVNKADDMQLDDDETDKLVLTGELNEMYEQVEKTIITEFERKNIAEHLIGIMPLCAVDSYLYRMVTKHGNGFELSPEQILKIGVNENGKRFSTLKPATQAKKVYEILQDKTFINEMIKLSGFSCLEKTLHKFLNENNTGNIIRIDNLLFELKKYENLIYHLSKSNALYCETFENLVEKHITIYEAIKKIDFEMFEEHMKNVVEMLNITLKDNVKHYSYNRINNLIEDYCNLQEKILKVYFKDYCITTDFPDYLKEYIYGLIISYTSNSYAADLSAFVEDLTILKKINYCENNLVFNIIQIILSKPDINKSYEDKNIINLLNILDELSIDLTELLRFILLHKIKAELNNVNNDDLLFIKNMIYKKYKEIPIQTYLASILPKLNVSTNVVVNGLNDKILSNSNIVVDLYYLNYVTVKEYKL